VAQVVRPARSAAHTLWRPVSLLLSLVVVVVVGCGRGASRDQASGRAGVRPSILLVTLDTTRADAIGPDALGVETPSFDALAARGQRFRQAYATVPETLPSHTSMMTGLYPAGHGVHENARHLSERHVVLAERLREAGYRTSAFVSTFTLAHRFGLARGFDLYDDDLPPSASERPSSATTDAAIAQMSAGAGRPLFMWVHYYDPHYPYAPPEPFRTKYAARPYLGEIAEMDLQLGRLVQEFERRIHGPSAILVVADHGEGLGDHGESQHGALLYQSTMHVPLVIVGAGVAPGVSDVPVSTRRIFHTILDFAGVQSTGSLRAPVAEPVLGEAMKPFLEYGWQPQVMLVARTIKAILAGKLEAYDIARDAPETHDLGNGVSLEAPARKALEEYPAPAPDAARAPDSLDEDARRRLASLGYVAAGTAPIVRKGAPRPADMTGLLDDLDRASGLFVDERYADVIPLLERILAKDPYNLDATLRLATAHSALGHDERAEEIFGKAASIAPSSADVRLYLALHYARTGKWQQAVPLLERIVAESPDRLPALEALAALRERQGRALDAITLHQKIYTLRTPSAPELVQLGELAMSAAQTRAAIASFEEARRRQGASFTHDLELGVLYLAAGRLADAKAALDRVPGTSAGYSMALFKRAQVSVLLHEPDAAERIEMARAHADATTKPLIARERLFARN
jgi:choline-sulfatase